MKAADSLVLYHKAIRNGRRELAYPGLRGGKVIVEKRLNGSLGIRFKDHYLKYKVCGATATSRALPPNPRSLSHLGIPPEVAQSKSRATTAAQPSAVYPVGGRSGRTPAEPYRPADNHKPIAKKPWRPGPEHPWRKFRIKKTCKQEDILTLVK